MENSGQKDLNAGQLYDIRVEYYEAGWGSTLRLRWTPPAQAKQLIPSTQLFPPDPVEMRTLYIGSLYEEDITPGHGKAYTMATIIF